MGQSRDFDCLQLRQSKDFSFLNIKEYIPNLINRHSLTNYLVLLDNRDRLSMVKYLIIQSLIALELLSFSSFLISKVKKWQTAFLRIQGCAFDNRSARSKGLELEIQVLDNVTELILSAEQHRVIAMIRRTRALATIEFVQILYRQIKYSFKYINFINALYYSDQRQYYTYFINLLFLDFSLFLTILSQQLVDCYIKYLSFIMDDDMRKSLLTNKGYTFQKLYEQCLVKIQRIKQKNDFMQKQIGSDLEETIKQEVRRQKEFLQSEINQIKLIMDEIESRFRDPESKTKLKNIKSQAQKQIQRNKVIMKDLITKSFMVHSRGNQDPNDDQEKYIEGGKIHYDTLDHKGQNKDSVITENNNDKLIGQQIDLDFEIERKILAQKKQLIAEVEQTALRVNGIMTDMAGMVNQQGQNLDVISQELLKAQKNVEETNQQLTQASKHQKKSRKKYILLVFLIILIIGGVLGVIFILGK